MLNTFELVTKFNPIVDDHFVNGSKTVILEQGNKFLDLNFKESGYVKMAEVLLDGQSDYYKHREGLGDAQHRAFNNTDNRDGFGNAGVSLKWKIYELRYLRGTRFEIDAISNEQSANTVLGNVVELFITHKLIPEVDAIRFSAIADATSASLGNLIVESGDIDPNTIISKFNKAAQWLSEHEVSKDEIVIFVRPTIMTLIRNSSELNKFITQGDFRSPNGIDFTVEKYLGFPIVVVNDSRFYTNIYVDPNNGYRPSANSKLINFMFVSVRATLPIRKLEVVQLYGPEQAGITGFYGYIMNFLQFHDLIIPDNKVPGLYVDVAGNEDTASKAASLSVDIREGDVTNAWKLKNYFSNPSGMRGTVVYGANEFTLGAELTGQEGTDYFVIAKGEQKVEAATEHYFALVDDNKKIIAVAGKVTLVKKA